MEDKYMSSEFNVVKEDLSAYKESITNNRIDAAIMYSNRFISDSVLLLPPEKKEYFTTYGFMLRIIGEDFGQIQRSDNNRIPEEMTQYVNDFLITVMKNMPDYSGKYVDICNSFTILQKQISKFQITPLEGKVYSKNYEIVQQMRNSIIAILMSNKELIYEKNSNFLNGLMNELTRVCRVHGFEEKELTLYMSLKVLSLIIPYHFHSLNIKNVDLKSNLTNEFDNLLNQVLNFIESIQSKEGKDLWEGFMKSSNPILIRWRYDFIFFTDLARAPNLVIKTGNENKEEIKEGNK